MSGDHEHGDHEHGDHEHGDHEPAPAAPASPAVPLETRLRAALEAHRGATGERVLAESARGRTTRVPWDESGDVVVKETRPRAGVRGAVSSLLFRSRARRAFEASLALEGAGVPVALALGLLEEAASAVLVLRHVAGERLDAALATALERDDGPRVRTLALAAAELAARLHVAQVAHGDLKPANIVIDAHDRRRLVALDLDGARLGDVGARARAKDLAALDAYGQRGERRVSRKVRLEAFAAYVARADLDPDEARALLRAVVARSLWKRARWRGAGA